MLVYHKNGEGILDLDLATLVRKHSETQIYVELEYWLPTRQWNIKTEYQRGWGSYYKTTGCWIIDISIEDFKKHDQAHMVVANFQETMT